jgi:hypothetical protein
MNQLVPVIADRAPALIAAASALPVASPSVSRTSTRAPRATLHSAQLRCVHNYAPRRKPPSHFGGRPTLVL